MNRQMYRPHSIAVGACVALGALCLGAPAPDGRFALAAYPAPVASTRGAVAADHELASRAGAEILARGGNAVDAAVAAALAPRVGPPAGSRPGGGGLPGFPGEDRTLQRLGLPAAGPLRA